MDNTRNSVDIHEASKLLGISIEALRKRIQRGKLEGYKVDGRWYVVLDMSETESRTEKDTVQDNSDDVQTQKKLITSLEEEIAFLRQELSARTEENRRKDHIIAGLTQRIPELPMGQTDLSETLKQDLLNEVHSKIATTVERLEKQGLEREARLEERDRLLMQTLRQMQETTQKQIAAANEKPKRRWFGFSRR